MHKKILLLPLLLLLFSFLSAQDIKYFFKILPAFYTKDLNGPTKDSLLQRKNYYPASNDSEEVIVYKLEELDLKKNFLRIEMSYETGQRAFIAFELRSFKVANGNSIIVFSNTSGAPHEYLQNNLTVFSYNKAKGLSQIKSPGLITKVNVKYFFKNNTPDSVIKRHENYPSITYELGYEGENITLNFGESYGVEEIDRKWLLGDAIEFVWKDSHFIRHKPIFKE